MELDELRIARGHTTERSSIRRGGMAGAVGNNAVRDGADQHGTSRIAAVAPLIDATATAATAHSRHGGSYQHNARSITAKASRLCRNATQLITIPCIYDEDYAATDKYV